MSVLRRGARSSALSVLRSFALVAVVACEQNPLAPRQISPSLAKAPSHSTYAATFADAVTDRLRSDGAGDYVDGVACVTSIAGSAGGGVYQLRSIANTPVCLAQTRGTWRGFTIDFGSATVDLDQDGVAEAIEAAPARLLADNAFAQGATTTPVKIYVLEVLADGTTTQNTKWTLQYTGNASVSGTATKTIQALPGNATVKLYAGTVSKGSVPVATIDLPFKLTLTP
jgi:hypothetical protein